MMKRLCSAIVLACVASLLTACVDTGPSVNYVVDRGNEYMAALKARDYDKAFTFYGEEFFTTQPAEAWREYLDHAHESLGAMDSFKLAHKSKDTRFSGIFYVLQYKTEYANDNAREIVTFVYPIDSKELKIFAHNIQADVLEQR